MSDPATPDNEMEDHWWEQRAEAFEAWADHVASASLQPADTRALQAITRLAELREEVDAAILEAVRDARSQRHTWAEIGVMLGVTRQAAQHKYGPKLDDVPVEGARAVLDVRRRESLDRMVAIADEGGMYERAATPQNTR